MQNKYIAITEVKKAKLYVEPIEFTKEEFEKVMEEMRFFPTSLWEPVRDKKSYEEIELSEETFNFIESVANISSPIFGEKEYKINDLTFKIYKK